MIFGGLTKFSLKDYPGKVSCIVYTSGCNFVCPFCHNGGIVLDPPSFPKTEVMDFLEERKGQLDGVVITGGEPTIHSDLGDFCWKVKDLGYLVKLDTNGYKPEVIHNLIKNNIIDFIAMDVKTSWEKYNLAAGVTIDQNKIKKSIEIIKESDIQKIFRTTVVPGLVNEEDIEKIREYVSPAPYYLNDFSPEHVLDSEKMKDIYERFCGGDPYTK